MTTPTGVPIIDCHECGHRHPAPRRHCPTCGLATLFGHTHWEDLDQLTIFDEIEAP